MTWKQTQSNTAITWAKRGPQKQQAFPIQTPDSRFQNVLALLRTDNHISNHFWSCDLAILWAKTLPHPPHLLHLRGGGAACFGFSLHHTRNTYMAMEISLIPSPLTLLRSGCIGGGGGGEIESIKKLRVVSILPLFVPSLLGSHYISQTLL